MLYTTEASRDFTGGFIIYCERMIKVICSYCGRYREKEGDTGGIASHTICAFCAAARHDTRELYTEDELKEMIGQEWDVWQGGETAKYSDEEQVFLDRLLAEVQAEKNGEVRR